jgi:hypothetical protein
VVKDVVIDAGVKLIIEPGVEVRFEKNVSLTIYGSFEAVGTKNNPIIITSNEIFPAVGDWNTIEFKGSANDTFRLQYCIIQYAMNAITIGGKGDIHIEKSEIRFNENGIYGNVKDTLTGIRILNNSIFSNFKNGINLTSYGSQARIRDMLFIGNSIFNNGGDGIGLYCLGYDEPLFIGDSYASGYAYNITFEENNIHGNIGNGLKLFASGYSKGGWPDGVGSGTIHTINIAKNIFCNNTGTGIALDSKAYCSPMKNAHVDANVYEVKFTENIISSNGQGISLSAKSEGIGGPFGEAYVSAEIRSVNISKNDILCNEGNGISASVDAHAFKGNGFTYIELAINWNNISQNGIGLCVAHANIARVNAEYNFWGNITGPYHKFLNPAGTGDPIIGEGVDFMPFLPLLSNGYNSAVIKTFLGVWLVGFIAFGLTLTRKLKTRTLGILLLSSSFFIITTYVFSVQLFFQENLVSFLAGFISIAVLSAVSYEFAKSIHFGFIYGVISFSATFVTFFISQFERGGMAWIVNELQSNIFISLKLAMLGFCYIILGCISGYYGGIKQKSLLAVLSLYGKKLKLKLFGIPIRLSVIGGFLSLLFICLPWWSIYIPGGLTIDFSLISLLTLAGGVNVSEGVTVMLQPQLSTAVQLTFSLVVFGAIISIISGLFSVRSAEAFGGIGIICGIMTLLAGFAQVFGGLGGSFGDFGLSVSWGFSWGLFSSAFGGMLVLISSFRTRALTKSGLKNVPSQCFNC